MGGGSSAAVRQATNDDNTFDYTKHLHLQKEEQAHREECKDEGSSEILRHPAAKDGVWDKGCECGDKTADNIWEIWQYAVKTHSERNCLGWRMRGEGNKPEGAYVYETYEETGKIVEQLACAMAENGVKRDVNVGIFSKNRPEWTQAMLACQALSARTVALYDTLGEEALEHILKQAEIEVLFTEVDKLGKLKAILDRSAEAKVRVVVISDFQEKYGNKAEELTDENKKCLGDVKVIGMSEFVKSGTKELKEVADAPGGKDLANIMYTSGTTGLPKGVMLSHNGLACAVQAAVQRLTEGDIVEAGGRHYSYLPLAHIFELMVEICSFRIGLSISFTNGNIKLLAEDLGHVRPTMFIGVPRIYSKFYEKFMTKVEAMTGPSKKIASGAVKNSSIYIRDNTRSWFYDKLVWKGAAKQMGLDKCKLMITGAAPMPGYLMEFMKVVANCPMIQGYGLTETTANGGISLFADTTVGHIGIPTIANEMRVIAVPEMNYLPTDKTKVGDEEISMPRGEIQIRGPPCFAGYYKMPEKTKEVLADDGWFSTGDIGRINRNGTMSIIDRKKNIFKLSQGEYVAVEKIENQYGKSASLNQIWAYGNSHKAFLVGVAVPNAQWVALKLGDDWKCEATPATKDYNDYYLKIATENYEKIKKWVLDDMKGNQGKLKGFEKIRDVHLELVLDELLQGFNVDNNCLTPSFKLKRPQLLARYTEKLQKLYVDNGAPPKQGEKW